MCTCIYPATRRPLCVVLVWLLCLYRLVLYVSALFRCPAYYLPWFVCFLWASLFDVLVCGSSGRPCLAIGPTFGARCPPSTVLPVSGGHRWFFLSASDHPRPVHRDRLHIYFCLCLPGRREPGSKSFDIVEEPGKNVFLFRPVQFAY